jgi:DNA-binding beta-propeller fold protein YncE
MELTCNRRFGLGVTMRLRWKKAIAILAMSVVVALVVAGGALIYPGMPSEGKTVHFQSFIPIEGSRMVNALDYMLIRGDQLFVVQILSGIVDRIPIGVGHSSETIISLEGSPSAHGVAIDPVSNLGFVTRSGANVVEVFNPDTMHSVKSIEVSDDPDAILYAPDPNAETGMIYVSHGDSKTGTIIDPARQVVVGTIQLKGTAEFSVFDKDSGLVYQNLQDVSQLIAIDIPKKSIVGRWDLQGCVGPQGLALDQADHLLLIACGGNSKAGIFDLEKHKIVATLPIGKASDTIAYDSGLRRAYAAGSLGKMTVLQGNANGVFDVVDSVRTHLLAHTLAVDQATHRIYLGYAGFAIGPRLAVFEAVK